MLLVILSIFIKKYNYHKKTIQWKTVCVCVKQQTVVLMLTLAAGFCGQLCIHTLSPATVSLL